MAALAVLTAIRLVVAATAPLSPDEAYYWVWSRALAPGYLDHPLMVALWIRLGTLLADETALGVRLLAPFAAALGSILLSDAANRLFPSRRPGLQAAILLNATLLFGVGAVTMTPDTPLLFFWTLAAWALARLATQASPQHWLLVGLAAGLALDSKYTAALLGLGIALWLLTPAARHHLRTPWPWLGGAVAILLFLPTILWNAGHGWASFAKQGGRTGSWEPARALGYVGELLAGQIGLATPIIATLFVIGVITAVHRWRTASNALLAALVLPGAIVFLQHALGDRVQANWVAILYPGAALAAAGLVIPTARGDDSPIASGRWDARGLAGGARAIRPLYQGSLFMAVGISRWWVPATALGFTLTALLYLQVALSPFTLPRRLDPTLRIAGWDQLATQAQAAAKQEGSAFLASEEYSSASMLAWSTPSLPVLAASSRWTFFALPAPAEPSIGLLLVSTRRREPPDPALWQTADPLGTVQRRHGDLPIEEFRLYRVVSRPGAPIVVLPSRNAPSPAAP